MGDPASHIYTVDYIGNNQYPALQAVLQETVALLNLEFLQQGGPKPHAVFHLNLAREVHTSSGTFTSCRLAMDYTGPDLFGEFRMKLLTYFASSTAAHASFQFPVLRAMTVDNYIRIFAGLTTHTRGSLLDFDFVTANVNQDLDGCRDFIAQCFIRLHQRGIVGWEAVGIGAGQFGSTYASLVERTGFHRLIGNNYKNIRELDPRTGLEITTVTPLPLHRGTFFDQQVQRIERYQGHRLPYIPEH